MSDVFRFPSSVRDNPFVEAWFSDQNDVLRQLARPWFERMRDCGEDVRELLQDGWPTACAGDAAFAYVAAFSAHVNIGFYQGASLTDPEGLLYGGGKRMRHVKLKWGQPVNEAALGALIEAAYADIKQRVADEG